jgi:hypothetical protein
MVCRSSRARHLEDDDCLQNNMLHLMEKYVMLSLIEKVVVAKIVKTLKHKMEDNLQPYKIS